MSPVHLPNELVAQVRVAPPQAGWAVCVVELVWESGDWRLDHETATPGPAPTPMLDASATLATTKEFDAALAGFTVRDGQ
ncbi:MAG: hypothetical protein ACRDV9_07095 [Acidimicrobiia bacterium]